MTDALQERIIFTGAPAHRRSLWELLEGLVVSELLSPSPELWVVSPWISDIPLVDDSAGRFRAVNEQGKNSLGLIDVLGNLASRGTSVCVVTRPGESTVFVSRFEERARNLPDGRMRVLLRDTLHAKGWATARYCIWGSMNFTFSGLGRWDELVSLRIGAGAGELQSLFRSQYDPGIGEGASGAG